MALGILFREKKYGGHMRKYGGHMGKKWRTYGKIWPNIMVNIIPHRTYGNLKKYEIVLKKYIAAKIGQKIVCLQ
jgi:hypothetical protein